MNAKLDTYRVFQFVLFVAGITFTIHNAHAQPASSADMQLSVAVEALPKCSAPKESVQLVEDTNERNVARLESYGVAQSVMPVVEELIKKSGCYVVKPDAPLKLKVSVPQIVHNPTMLGVQLRLLGQGEVWIVNFDVLMSLEGSVKPVEVTARGQAELRRNGPLYTVAIITGKNEYMGNLRNEAYTVPLRIALENALSKLTAMQGK